MGNDKNKTEIGPVFLWEFQDARAHHSTEPCPGTSGTIFSHTHRNGQDRVISRSRSSAGNRKPSPACDHSSYKLMEQIIFVTQRFCELGGNYFQAPLSCARISFFNRAFSSKGFCSEWFVRFFPGTLSTKQPLYFISYPCSDVSSLWGSGVKKGRPTSELESLIGRVPPRG